MQIVGNKKWGFLRETMELAQKAGKDKDTGLHRTGLDEYLKVIFPNTVDWVHDKPIGKIDGMICRKRPDYRSEEQKIIIEFDGVQHYTSPLNIIRDRENSVFYEKLGYKVVRVPYFIQFTNKVVEQLFGITVSEELFDESIPSMGPEGKNTPAFLCNSGIERMAQEFHKFPEQYRVNMEFMKKQDNQFLVRFELLEEAYNKYAFDKVRKCEV